TNTINIILTTIPTRRSSDLGPITKNNTIEPVYSIKGKITVKGMRRFIAIALQEYSNLMMENLPSQLLNRYKLLSKKEAVQFMHLDRKSTRLNSSHVKISYAV